MSLHNYVAIVDDDASVCRAIGRLLSALNVRTEAFYSAESFLLQRRAHDWTCLILDVRLPGMDGFELQRRLAALDDPVPILFLTGQGGEQQRQRARLAGALDLLTKPVDEDALIAGLQSALGRQEGRSNAGGI